MKIRILCSALATIALSLSLAACGAAGGTSSKQAAGSLAGAAANPAAGVPSSAKPCALIAQGDAEAAVGQPLGAPKEDVVLGSCTYASSDFAAGVIFTAATWDSIKLAAQGAPGTKPPDSIGGVGDEALARGGSYLAVRKGSRAILLVINGPLVDGLPDHGLSRVEDLARTILPKL